MDDPKLGGLYLHILRIIHHRQPSYVILENVPNLEHHSDGKSWDLIRRKLEEEEGYNVDIWRISPHDYGWPQIRNRMYIVAARKGLDFDFARRIKRGRKHKEIPLKSVLLKNPIEARALPDYVKERLDAWQEFLDILPKGERFPHPLWSMEFGATYPFERTTPSAMKTRNLRRYLGSFGCKLSDGKSRREVMALLPSHARTLQNRFPRWKVRFIQRNREFYEKRSEILEPWLEKVKKFPSSFQKFEWNCQKPNPLDENRHLDRFVIQIRPSGVRVKLANRIPSLVAMNATQVPIIAWESRYMTPTEGKLLQSMDDLKFLPESNSRAYEALGNAVNVRVARRVAMALVGRAPVEGASVVRGQKVELSVSQTVLPMARG